MANKPTYEELEKRVEELEKAVIMRDAVITPLKSTESVSHAIFETAPISIILIDEKGIIFDINPHHVESIGKGKATKEDYISGSMMEHPSVVGAGMSEIYRGVLKGKSFNEKTVYFPHTTGGSDAYFNVRGAPVIRDGEIIGAIIIHEDITELVRIREKLQKTHDELDGKVRERTRELQEANEHLRREIDEHAKAENELSKTKALLDSVMEQSPMPMALVTADGTIEILNKATIDMMGSPNDEIRPGMKVSEIKRSWQTLDAEGVPIPIEQTHLIRALKGDVARGKEHQFVRKDGKKIWISAYAVPIQDSKGNIIAGFAAYPDITKRKHAEEQVRVSNDKFSGIFNASPNAIAITNFNERRFLDANDKFIELSGYSREEIIGHTVHELNLWGEQEQSDRYKKLLQENGEVLNLEMTFLRRSGEQGTGFISSVMINLDGEPCVLAILNDISAFRHLENQLRQAHKMEAVGTLAGGIAHEFNNILGIIVGNMELAMGDVPEWNPAYHNLEEIRIASLRARDIVKQILAFSRQTQHILKPVSLNSVVTETLKLLRSSIPSTIEIRKNATTDSDMILADHTQINQILINLCTNATHAMLSEGGVLDVSITNISLDEDSVKSYDELTPGKYVELTVSDTGAGIETDTIDRIFDPYFTTKEVGEGSGMGLSVVHGIVKGHKGDITVSSDSGKGTSFRVLMPIVEEEIKPEIKNKAPLLRGSERILFVDDEKSLGLSAKRNLEDLGYRVEIERNSVRALSAFREEPKSFDLIITDTTMPGMSGDKLAQEIMKIRSDIPIILCTGYSERISEEEAKDLGIAAFVMKPILKDEIAATIRTVLDKGKKASSGTERIIIIDDDEQIRSMLKQALESCGYDVSEASDGNVALWLNKEKAADLIITDIIMPEKEGIETIMELKQDYPGVKIIAISGGGQGGPKDYLRLAKLIGADRTLAKPFEMEELLKAVRDLL